MYAVGDAVYVLNFRTHGSKWVPAVVIGILNAMNYRVQVEEAIWKRHHNQIRPQSTPISMQPELQTDSPKLNLPQLPMLLSPTAMVAPSVAPPATVAPDHESACHVACYSGTITVCSRCVSMFTSSSGGQDRPRRVTQKPVRPRRVTQKPVRYRD